MIFKADHNGRKRAGMFCPLGPPSGSPNNWVTGLKRDRQILEQGAWLWRSSKARPGLLTARVSEPCWGRAPSLHLLSKSSLERWPVGERRTTDWCLQGRRSFAAEPFLPEASCSLPALVASMASVDGSQLWSYC